MPKKLYLSQKDKKFLGVIGGLAEYYHFDVLILRLAFILLVLLTGIFPGVVFYFIAAIIIPTKPKEHSDHNSKSTESQSENDTTQSL